MMNQHSITTLPPSPEDERRARMIKYTITMSIRVLCIFLMLFAQGWWLAVCAAGAIFLPYVAVVFANVGGGRGRAVERPGGIVVSGARRNETGGPDGVHPDETSGAEGGGAADDRGGAAPSPQEGEDR